MRAYTQACSCGRNKTRSCKKLLRCQGETCSQFQEGIHDEVGPNIRRLNKQLPISMSIRMAYISLNVGSKGEGIRTYNSQGHA